MSPSPRQPSSPFSSTMTMNKEEKRRQNKKVAGKSLGLYLHIPFCEERCSYCDFLTFPKVPFLHQGYVDALCRDIILSREEGLFEGRTVDTIYIGGGTPTILTLPQLDQLLTALHSLPLDIREWTVEVNPGTLSDEKLDLFIQGGVNRISFGVQTMDPDLLAFCKRTHRPETVYRDMDRVRSRGPGDLAINMDFIYGIPGQETVHIDRDLAAIRDLGPDHISWYSLILEEKTLLDFWIRQGRTKPLSPDRELALMERAFRGLEDLGYTRYEVSNFARAGKVSLHNLKYWTGQDYLGLGLGASSYLDHRRFKKTGGIGTYSKEINQGRPAWTEEVRTEDDDLFEGLMMGLRKVAGIDRAAFRERMGVDPLDRSRTIFEKEKALGLVDWTEETLFLTPKGFDLQNEVLMDLMEDFHLS